MIAQAPSVAETLGEYYYGRDEWENAEQYLLVALDIVDGGYRQFSASEFKINTLLAHIYEETGQEKKASARLNSNSRLRNSAPRMQHVLLYEQAPKYPEEALLAGVEGYVELRIGIDRKGRVLDPVVVELVGHPSFEAAAVQAVNRWVYWPAFIDGSPVDKGVLVSNQVGNCYRIEGFGSN